MMSVLTKEMLIDLQTVEWVAGRDGVPARRRLRPRRRRLVLFRTAAARRERRRPRHRPVPSRSLG